MTLKFAAMNSESWADVYTENYTIDTPPPVEPPTPQPQPPTWDLWDWLLLILLIVLLIIGILMVLGFFFPPLGALLIVGFLAIIEIIVDLLYSYAVFY